MAVQDFDRSYFGFQWDRETHSRPWRDHSFLVDVYESDHAPTQQEIADRIGCSVTTITNHMPEDAQRGGPGLPYEDIAMFSGGYDSLVATHYSMEELGCDAVLHIDTQTGIPENQQFVEKVCDWFDWPLEIVTPNKTLEEFAKEYGFPKAPAHSWIYRYLKEHPLARFTTSLETDQPSYYTGVRKNESARRMENVSTETQEMWNGRWLWEAPIAEFTEEDISEYIVEHGLPRNPVAETIGRSGECFCGAYADRFAELLTLEDHYPEHYDWIMETEADVQDEIGTDEDHCYWGTSGMSSDELQELMESEGDDPDMLMCVDCEGEGHRTLGHEKDPTYERIYIAGPRCTERDRCFHEQVTQYDTTAEWVNPFDLNEYNSEDEARRNADEVYGTDLDAVRQSDVVLLRRVEGYNLSGASIEAAVGMEKYGTPVIVYNEADSEIPLMLEALATEVTDDMSEAVQLACSYGRKVIQDRSGDDVLVA